MVVRDYVLMNYLMILRYTLPIVLYTSLLQLFLIRKSYRPPKGGLGGQAWRGGYE